MSIESFQKNSPGEVVGTAVREVTSALRDILSIGKQVEDFRMASVRIEEAKLELEKKREELQKARENQTLRNKLKHLELEVEKAQKELELEKLRTQRDEEVRKRRKLFLEDVDNRFETLMKGIRILSEIPEEIRNDFKVALQTELEILRENPFVVDDISVTKIEASPPE